MFYSAKITFLAKKAVIVANLQYLWGNLFNTKKITMSDVVLCPKCQSEFTYENDNLMVCSQCFYEWNPEDNAVNENKILDANGNELQTGDSVVVVKDLPVKGAPKPVKAGTKVKNIRLNFDSDHNIDCKIDGFGSMALKSEFVKKA